ncbi:MAG: stage II sporulation protein P [Marvinbryantia sp.]|jgi:stage II sporulation protein P
MRLLERIIRAVLMLCMAVLAGYIIIRGITIAEENGLFKNTPVLSAIYQKAEEWMTGTYIPVLSYVQKQEQSEEDIEKFSSIIFPVYSYARQQKNGAAEIESGSEYELIVRAQAEAEENKQPVEMEEFVKQQEKKEREDGDSIIDEAQRLQYQELLNKYFSLDAMTTIDAERLNGEKLLSMDMTMEKRDEPQILIYHTHSQEAFVDSVEGDVGTTIVGVGEYLKEILEEQYGYQVIHETGVFDLVNGVLDRNVAYDYSEAAVTEILQQNPSIEVVIDLHRDGVDGIHFVTEYKGKPTAKLMLIVGMSRTADGEDISYLPNPYIEDNLAFALQLQLTAEEQVPGLMRNIYLMAYRFNLHLKPMSLLVEAGTQLNTVEEERNAMEALAELLNEVLQGR